MDDDEESEMATPSTSAYSSFESSGGKAEKENEEEIEVDLEMAEDEEDP